MDRQAELAPHYAILVALGHLKDRGTFHDVLALLELLRLLIRLFLPRIHSGSYIFPADERVAIDAEEIADLVHASTHHALLDGAEVCVDATCEYAAVDTRCS